MTPTQLRSALGQAQALATAGDVAGARRVLVPCTRAPAVPAAIWAALGRLDLAAGDPTSARKNLERAAALAPNAPGVLEALGVACWHTGDLDSASRLLGTVIRRWPDRVLAHVTLADVRLRQRRLRDVDHLATTLARIAPTHPHHHRLRALAAVERGQLELADRCLRTWLQHHPEAVEARGLLADLLSRARRFDEAEALFQSALDTSPTNLVLRTRYAHHRGRQGHFDEAHTIFADVARHSPHQGAHLANRGIAEMWTGQLDAAVASLQAAVELEPHNASHRWNLSHALLQSGDLATGFEVYEQRIALFGPPDWWEQRWRGESLPPGSPLVLDAMQGLGDAIQFVRFAADAEKRGAQVIVRAHPRLMPLFAGARGVARVVSSKEPPPTPARRSRLLSLPHVLGIHAPEQLGHHVPYIQVPSDRRATWAERLAGPGVRVGIVWQGNPSYEQDHLRSPPLAHFLPLTRIPGVQLFSLQKFHGVDQLDAVDPQAHPIPPLGPQLDRDVAFLDTAAAMHALDLVLTSDTSIAHLAGALGVPTWVVLPYAPDWRWPRTSHTSAWYPTMRLFRQTRPGDWAGVFDRVAEALTAHPERVPSR